ncbi:MAG: NrfD/PsrC family molybdoenzyme membrane anchor subunit [Acidimicrobiales bacterium]
MSVVHPSSDGPGGTRSRRRRGEHRGERPMVPRADFRSYYGRPVLQPPSWKAYNIAGYFFLGGLAAGSSLLAVAGELTGRPLLRRAGRLAAGAAFGGSLVALIEDLGRPSRFLNMLRVFRPTSPMSVGSWLFAAYGPLAGLAAVSEVAARDGKPDGWAVQLGTAGNVAGFGTAGLAPALATYTAVLLADTAVPTWHEAHRELPFVFAGSSASSSGGLAMAMVPVAEAGPARWFAALGTTLELVSEIRMERRLGKAGEPLRLGRPGGLMMAARVLGGAGALVGGVLGRRSRPAAIGAGLAMFAGSACARFGIFLAGVAASEDPSFTVVPQRERLVAGP